MKTSKNILTLSILLAASIPLFNVGNASAASVTPTIWTNTTKKTEHKR